VEAPKYTRAEREARLAELRSIAARRGYKPAWAGVKFKEQFGFWPRSL